MTQEKCFSGLITVGIHDKISSLKNYFASETSAGGLTVIYNQEIIRNDETFFKRQIKQHDKFMLLSGSFEAKKWKRFPKSEQGDYFYMSNGYYDAVAFKPKVDVYLLGFGFMNQYEKKEFKLKFKYNVDGQDSEEKELDMT